MTMIESFPRLFRRQPVPVTASGPRGRRAYVVGDVHGRLDLLDELIGKIESDLKERPTSKALLVFVGDLIDRGPESAGVIERLRSYRRSGVETIFLLGNHEEVLLRILRGDAGLITSWLRFGGMECLASYGVDGQQVADSDDERALAAIRGAIPTEHVAFLETFGDTCRFGDYLFVHAGIRPGTPLEQQSQNDMRWIRDPFLFDDSDHGFVVVHGHTICPEVEELPNRIGLDTGAYRTNVLSALIIDGAERRLLDTRRAANGQPVEAAN